MTDHGRTPSVGQSTAEPTLDAARRILRRRDRGLDDPDLTLSPRERYRLTGLCRLLHDELEHRCRPRARPDGRRRRLLLAAGIDPTDRIALRCAAADIERRLYGEMPHRRWHALSLVDPSTSRAASGPVLALVLCVVALGGAAAIELVARAHPAVIAALCAVVVAVVVTVSACTVATVRDPLRLRREDFELSPAAQARHRAVAHHRRHVVARLAVPVATATVLVAATAGLFAAYLRHRDPALAVANLVVDAATIVALVHVVVAAYLVDRDRPVRP